MKTLLKSAAVISTIVSLASAQSLLPVEDGARAVRVQMVVTVEPFHGSEVPPIDPRGLKVLQGKTNLPVTEWVPLQGEMAALELYVLIDERVDPSATGRFDELRRFISAQAATTSVGVAYMDNGGATIAQIPTKDHASAAKALRLPSGDDSAAANPFTSLSALINGWSVGSPRRVVLVVTDGVDVFEDLGGASTYLDIAIADAQRAGVEAFCLFAPAAGHAGHSPALIRGGQAYLAQLAEETGGEAYLKEGEVSPSFEPYLIDVAEHLAHQFLITFLAMPVTGVPAPIGGMEFLRVAFRTRLPSVELIAAHGFYLKAEGSRP